MSDPKRKCSVCKKRFAFSKEHLAEYGHVCEKCLNGVKKTLDDLPRLDDSDKYVSNLLAY